MRIACLLFALAAPAAGQSVQEIEIARARNLLHSPQWVEKAWGAYFAGQLQSEEMNQPLIDALREGASLRDVSWDAERGAYLAALFDAAIQSGTMVPAEVLEPFEEKWRAQVIVLLARVDGEEALLKLDEQSLPDAQWLAINNLLLAEHSHRFFARTLGEVAITHTFTLTDLGDRMVGLGLAGMGGAGSCGDGVSTTPKGFPPIGMYEIMHPGQPGDVLLASGPENAYFRRTMAPSDKQTRFGSCGSGVVRQKVRLGYLVQISGLTEGQVRMLFEPDSSIEYRGDANLRVLWDLELSGQEAVIRQFPELARQHGWGSVEGVKLRIVPKLNDLRTAKTGTMPALTPREFVLD